MGAPPSDLSRSRRWYLRAGAALEADKSATSRQREPSAESAARYVHVCACVRVRARIAPPARASLLFSLHALAVWYVMVGGLRLE
ncbi:hypothetical protein OAO87_04425 [bacterium]|nr:hypothetical protein [bacterium]